MDQPEKTREELERENESLKLKLAEAEGKLRSCQEDNPVLGPEGRIGAARIIRNVTEEMATWEALGKSESRYRLLSESASLLLSTENPRKIIQDLCRNVMAALDCQAFFNYLVDEKTEKLRLNAYAGVPKEEAAKVEWLARGECISGSAALERGPIVAEDIFNTPPSRMRFVRSIGIQVYACHPLMVGDKLIGTLSFGSRSRAFFSPDQIDLMKTVTDQVAVAIERIRLIRELEKSRDELEKRVQERTAELALSNRALKKYSGKLERLNNELREFTWITAHDLQEPLRKIQTFGNLLEEMSRALDPKAQEHLQRILQSAKRMSSLIYSVKGYSDAARRQYSFEPTDLSSILEEALSDLEVAIRNTGARVEASSLPSIEADRTAMRQLFQNLIGNSIKYAKPDEPPVIRITGETTGDSCRIICEDNGIGFDEQYADYIFKPFKRLHGRNSSFEGTGMGLAICRKMVEMHGGTINAESTPKVKSKFVITLPLKQSGHPESNTDDIQISGNESREL